MAGVAQWDPPRLGPLTVVVAIGRPRFAARAAHGFRGGHADRRLQMEADQRLRGNLHLLSAGYPIDAGAHTAAGHRSDRCAFAASGEGADNGPERRAASGLSGRVLPSRRCPAWCMRRSPRPSGWSTVSMRVNSIDNSELPEKWVASLAVTTRPTTDAPERATTMPSTIRSPASEPWKTVFGWVVALSSVSVMRIGITVPGRKRHRLSHRRGRRRWRGSYRFAPPPGQEEAVAGGGRRGRGSSLSHYFLVPPALRSAPSPLCRGATTRLLTTVLTPSIEALSAAAKAREASLSTLPCQGSHPVGHAHLDVLTVQCRLGSDLGLNVTGNLLVVSYGERAPAVGGAGAACCCRRSGLVPRGGTDSLQPAPRTRKPVKTANGILRRIGKSVFMGEILGFRLLLPIIHRARRSSCLAVARSAYPFDEGNMEQADGRGLNLACAADSAWPIFVPFVTLPLAAPPEIACIPSLLRVSGGLTKYLLAGIRVLNPAQPVQ